MIAAILIPLYVIAGLVVARWTALRRMKIGNWEDRYGGVEDSYFAVSLAFLAWPVAAALYFVTRPPRATRLERTKKQVEELERELGISP